MYLVSQKISTNCKLIWINWSKISMKVLNTAQNQLKFYQENQAHRDQLEPLVHRATLGPLAQPVNQDNLELVVVWEPQDLVVSEPQELLVVWELQETWVPRVHMGVPQVNQEPPEQPALTAEDQDHKVQMVWRGPRVLPVSASQGQLEPLDPMDLRDTLGYQANQVSMVPQEHKVLPDHEVLPVYQEVLRGL
jgi:hypothetical protein